MKKAVFSVFSILFFILISISCFAETTYGPTWEETCNKGVCTRTLYSGYSPMFFENNLTNKESWIEYYNVIYIEIDPDFTIEVIDYNYTDFEMHTNFTGNASDYPDECTYKSECEAKCQFKTQIKNETSDIKFDYKWEMKNCEIIQNTYKFSYKGLPLGKEFKFGTNSTTVQLQDADSENLEDTYINQTNPTSNYSSSDILYLRPLNSTFSNKTYTYLKFNISSIPAGKTITEAKLELKMTIPSITGTPKQQLRHVYNQTWTEDTITWNNHPCDENMTNSGECNQTAEASTTYYGISSTSKNFTITNMVKKDYDDSNSNFSVIINVSCNDNPAGKDYYFLSKEYSTVSYRPTLYVTYTSGYPKWYSNQTSVPSKYNPTNLTKINITWNVSTISIDKVFIELNHTGTPTNYSMNNTTYAGDIYNYSILLGVGTYQWKSYANTTENFWNTSDTWYFTIAKNTTNPVHLNISNDNYATNTTNNNISVETDHTVKIHAYMGYSSAGTVGLYIDGTSQTNPYSNTFGEGAHAIKVNTSGNANYSANATGLTYYVIATSPTGGGTTGGGGSFQIIAPNVSFTLEPENPVLIAPLKTEFVQNISYKVCSQHTNELSIDVDFNYENIKAIMEKPFIVLPGECEIFDVEVTVFNLTEGKEYSIGMVATDINSREFRTSTITITTSFVSGTIKDVIGFFMSKLSWSYTIDGAHPITIPYMGLWTSLGAFVVVFWLITKGFKGQYRIRRLRGNKSLPFVVSTIVMILLLVFLIPI